MYSEIEKDIVGLLKNGNEKQLLTSYRLFKSEILKYSKDNKLEITNEIVEKVADKLNKEMEKSLLIVEDQKNRILFEITKLYLPQKTSKEELENWLKDKSGNKGELMKQAKIEFGNKLDGKILNSLIK